MGLDGFVGVVGWPMVFGLALSFLIESLLTPCPVPFWRRSWRCTCVHLGLWLSVFTLLLTLLRHPWFAMCLVDGFLLILVLINLAKVQALHEPFVFQDFEYFTDVVRHPRLYLPFLGIGKVLVGALIIVGVFYGSFMLEPSLGGVLTTVDFVNRISALLVVATFLLWIGVRRDFAPSFDPIDDLRRFGLLTSLWCYGRAEQKRVTLDSPFEKLAAVAGETMKTERPHIVVVQSESFFDPRRWCDNVASSVLKDFDVLRSQSLMHGQLSVSVWGANTVRSEFSFLSGLAPDKLGVHRFNPYRKLPVVRPPTIASYLRSLGYRTVCVHPYPASFYRRDKSYPLLGFGEFIDIESFSGAESCGAYISDAAVARKVEELITKATQPHFVFVITMENHGPLHLERVEQGEQARLHIEPVPPGCDDLTIYLRHLANASQMANTLQAMLKAISKPAWLAWYGDHVPIMPKVYQQYGLPDGDTDYLLWSNGTNLQISLEQRLSIQDFGPMILRAAGLGGQN